MSLTLQKYTEKSIVVRGETKKRITDIKAISGAKFGYYGGEPGWMFPATMEAQVRKTLSLPSGYVDGPAPLNRQGPNAAPFTPAGASGAGGSTSVIPAGIVKKVVVPRGSLRRPAVADPEVEEAKEDTMVVETHEKTVLLEAKVVELSSQVSQLKELVMTLVGRLEGYETIKETVATLETALVVEEEEQVEQTEEQVDEQVEE